MCYRFHSTLSYLAELASAFFTLVHYKCFHEHLGQNSWSVHASPAGISKALAKLVLWRNGKALQFSTDPASRRSQSSQMQQGNWAKFITADKRAIHVPISSFLALHLLHQNKLSRQVFVPSTHAHRENKFSPHLPAESVIWPPLIHGLVYSKKCECLFLMDDTQPETGGKKEKGRK